MLKKLINKIYFEADILFSDKRFYLITLPILAISLLLVLNNFETTVGYSVVDDLNCSIVHDAHYQGIKDDFYNYCLEIEKPSWWCEKNPNKC